MAENEVELAILKIISQGEPMTAYGSSPMMTGQMLVNQTPKYDGEVRKKGRRPNQVIGKAGIIRPDKRKKAKFL